MGKFIALLLKEVIARVLGLKQAHGKSVQDLSLFSYKWDSLGGDFVFCERDPQSPQFTTVREAPLKFMLGAFGHCP